MLLAVLRRRATRARAPRPGSSSAPTSSEPSEFAKIGLIVALASYCAAAKGRLGPGSWRSSWCWPAIPFALIYKQPDLGTALVLAAVLVAVLLIGGASGRHLAVLAVHRRGARRRRGALRGAEELPAGPADVVRQQPGPAQRGPAATAAGANEYNLAESKIAIGDGGVTGKGIGKGTQTNLSYVPEQRTDFIFTAVGEQVGLVGSRPAAAAVRHRDLAHLASSRAWPGTRSAP